MLKISQAVLASILVVFFSDLFIIMNQRKATKRFTIIASVAISSMLIGMLIVARFFDHLIQWQKTLLMTATAGASLVLLEGLDKEDFNIFFIIGAATTLLCFGIILVY